MKKILTLLRSDRGAATIEMAFAVPVLAMFLWGIFEIGVIFQANAGMQHALGEGARYATLWPSPGIDAIKQRF
jgi:Flp pilus assembly protein TadG